MFGLGVSELILLGLVAIILFGQRLPEVARSLGKNYHEFRRGLQEIQIEMQRATRSVDQEVRSATRHLTFADDDYVQPTAPQFRVPPAENASQDEVPHAQPQPTEASRAGSPHEP